MRVNPVLDTKVSYLQWFRPVESDFVYFSIARRRTVYGYVPAEDEASLQK